MAKLVVDGIEIDVPKEYSLLQAAEEAGAEIPRFCYHERLSIAGNCRMCLVEVKGGPPKPTASCAMRVGDLRPGRDGEPPEIFTKSPMVKKAREGVMEFLLINHPLDCPICDQGGECDLQDQAMAFGKGGSRFHENKRAVENKYIGPLVKTTMTRCIHCTRCVRFTTEVCGIQELGLVGRGEDAEITTYLEAALSSELQGNVIDLCPVGALTSRPYAFTARPWELTKTETIDVMDAVGSNIRVDSRGREVMRIQPRVNDAVNEEWISDKTRFIWDGLRSQRLDKPYLRKDGRLTPVSWDEAFRAIAARLDGMAGDRIGAIAGAMASVEELYALKSLMKALGSGNMDARQDGSVLTSAMGRAAYLFNATIEGIEEADAILIIGSNPRMEAAVLNARIRKTWLAGNTRIAVIGEQADLKYGYDYLGASAAVLADLADGKGAFFDVLKGAAKPLILIGQGAINHEDGQAVLAQAAKLAVACGALSAEWNGFSLLHTDASAVGALELGFEPQAGGKDIAAMQAGGVDALFFMGADELAFDAFGDAFKIYIGSHGDAGAHAADVILPAATYTEKSGHYINTEGRVQLALRANFVPGDAKEDWAILRALSAVLGKTLPFDSLDQLRARLFADHPDLDAVDVCLVGDRAAIEALAKGAKQVKGQALVSPIADYYLTNPIARASAVMAECSALAKGHKAEAAE
nr:NADH-quinone oxidoreductase subunit NuoG [uncultured Cohaesibacter sp.]